MPRMPCGQESLLYLLVKNRILLYLLPPLEGDDRRLNRRGLGGLAERPGAPVNVLADLSILKAGADSGGLPGFRGFLGGFRWLSPEGLLLADIPADIV